MEFWPKSEMDLKKHPKSIRFFTINHMVVRHVAKPYKANGKSILLKTHKPSKPQLIIIRMDNINQTPRPPPSRRRRREISGDCENPVWTVRTVRTVRTDSKVPGRPGSASPLGRPAELAELVWELGPAMMSHMNHMTPMTHMSHMSKGGTPPEGPRCAQARIED